jgi:hypothetical protein
VIQTFFRRFEKASNDLDRETLGELFCDVFLSLDPSSAAPVPRDVLLAALPARGKLFESIGVEGADLLDLVETPLDEQHILVETTWRTRFRESIQSHDPLILRSTFLLRREGADWRVAVYLNHQDIMAIIRERKGGPHGANGESLS